MVEVVLRLRPALAHAPLRARDASFALEALPEGRVIQALAPLFADPADVCARLSDLAGPQPFAVRPYAPGQWFVVSDAPLAVGELRTLAEAVGAGIALSDQSHGRVRLLVKGAKARHVLAKGTGVDLAPSAFPIGRSAQTLFGHIGIHITRTGTDQFELVALRSLAGSLWRALEQAGFALPMR